MQASRVLRNVASSSKSWIIQPRTSWDIAKSAANAGFNMLTSRAVRDNFVETLNKGTIVPDVLSQADHGAAMVLALYNDLDSPLIKQYKFDAIDFCEGVKPALENYHEVLGTLENELCSKDEDKEKISDNESSKEGEKDPPFTDKDLANVLEIERLLTMSTEEMREQMSELCESPWTKQAEDDPESFAGRLRGMVTDDYFEYIQALANTRRLLDKHDAFLYEEGSSDIQNVALLSARAKVIEIGDSTEDTAGIENIKDDELNLKEEEVDDDKIPVAVQIEVLYEMHQTYIPLMKKSSGGKQKKDNPEEEPVTKNNVAVGVFEGWLNGNPDGTSEIRWKLIMNREAWEFPLLTRPN